MWCAQDAINVQLNFFLSDRQPIDHHQQSETTTFSRFSADHIEKHRAVSENVVVSGTLKQRSF
jgi:hypothetical protein